MDLGLGNWGNYWQIIMPFAVTTGVDVVLCVQGILLKVATTAFIVVKVTETVWGPIEYHWKPLGCPGGSKIFNLA